MMEAVETLSATRATPPKQRKKRRDVHRADRFFFYALRALGFLVIVILAAIVIELIQAALPAFKQFGFSFLASTEWDPVQKNFGAAPFIYGTVMSSLLAVLIAIPISVGAALFLNELSHRWLASTVSFLIEMLAAIPSVVYGIWGIFVLAPFMREHVQPWLGAHVGPIPVVGVLFSGPPFGIGMLSAGIVLAIMITPTIAAISREVFRSIPNSYREAALGLGATRWEMIYLSVLRTAVPGLVGAVILGLGRALGETMAVTMIIGNRAQIMPSLFAAAQTMASVVANEYPEASEPLHLASLSAIGLSLFLVSMVVNSIARAVIWKYSDRGQSK